MKRYSIQPNKNIFACFMGLIASGYDLADESCDPALLETIRSLTYDEDILDYFRKARTATCKVNPYWPRAFLLSLASLCFPTKEPYTYLDFNALQIHIKSLSQVSPSEKTEDLMDWLKQLPSVIYTLQHNSRFEKIWSLYLNSLEERLDDYNLILEQSVSLTKRILCTVENDIFELVFVPNWLQAPQATDIVTINDTLYIIESQPNRQSIIHELLHQIFGNKLEACKDVIDEHLPLLQPVLATMLDCYVSI